MAVPLVALGIQPLDLGTPLARLQQQNMLGQQMQRQERLSELQERRLQSQEDIQRDQLLMQAQRLNAADRKEVLGYMVEAAPRIMAMPEPQARQTFEALVGTFKQMGLPVDNADFSKLPAYAAMAKQELMAVGEGGVMDKRTGQVVVPGQPKTPPLMHVPGVGVIDKRDPSKVVVPTPESGGAFGGVGIDAQMYNKLLALGPKIRAGTATPVEQEEYGLAYRHVTGAKTVGTPETGFTTVRPDPLPADRFPAPGGGAPPAQVETVRPPEQGRMTTEDAAKIASLEQATADVDAVANKLIKSDGSIDRSYLYSGQKVAGVEGIPFTEGRQLRQQARRAVEVLLRLRTGAAAPESEVESYLSQFFPSPADSDAAVREKLGRLRDLFASMQEMLRPGRPIMQGRAAPSGGQGFARPKTPAERDALAPGTEYVAPDGSIRVKQ